MIARREINAVANLKGVRVDGLSDHLAKMVVLGTVLPGGLSLEQQTEARVDAAFEKVAASAAGELRLAKIEALPATGLQRDGRESGQVLRLDCQVVRLDAVEPGDPDASRARAYRDSEEAWRLPLRSAYVPYDRSDYLPPEPDPELEARADANGGQPDPAAARAKMLRASEREWMQPLSAGLRLPR